MIPNTPLLRTRIVSVICIVCIAFVIGGCGRGDEQEEPEVIVVQEEFTATSQVTETISEPTETATETPLPTPTQVTKVEATVNVASLRVRQGPGTNTYLVAGLRFGNTITLEGRNGEGTWVKFDQGWVAAEFVDPEGEISMLPILSGDIDTMETSTPTATQTLTLTLTSNPTPTATITPISQDTNTSITDDDPTSTATP